MTTDAERELLAVVVHELRSPVAALAAISAALARDSPEPGGDRSELVRLAIAACRGIERTVRDANVASVTLERVDLRRIVEQAVTSTRLEGADVRMDVEPDLAPLDADPERLRQAIDNLLRNAITHTAGGSTVVVRAHSDGGQVLVAVSDHGPGIAAADQARIFEPGVRLEPRRPGSGLGLAVTRAIAAAHGGSVTVESAPNEGSTFTIALPRAR